MADVGLEVCYCAACGTFALIVGVPSLRADVLSSQLTCTPLADAPLESLPIRGSKLP